MLRKIRDSGLRFARETAIKKLAQETSKVTSPVLTGVFQGNAPGGKSRVSFNGNPPIIVQGRTPDTTPGTLVTVLVDGAGRPQYIL